jgi:hypothetical protein
MNKYDAVLYIVPEENILENNDPKIYAKKGHLGPDKAFNVHTNWDDPKLYNTFAFGRVIKRAIESNQGYYAEVSDFRKWVVVRVTYQNYENSRSATKTFLIVFKHDGDGVILSTHNRYRTISGAEQAVSYIRSACTQLQNSTQNKI